MGWFAQPQLWGAQEAFRSGSAPSANWGEGEEEENKNKNKNKKVRCQWWGLWDGWMGHGSSTRSISLLVTGLKF